MKRWDAQGEHIIVEKPEQLALHVLPSIYRQSRFASFSRQLNIYGFMRKVNLRNVDPAIDDPDASTWSHPTLNRYSSPEVVANFKRRVPPRLPKPRKRDMQEQQQMIPPPRSAVPGHTSNNAVPLSIPPSGINGTKLSNHVGRSRGFSAPGSFTPISQNSSQGSWGPSSYSHPRSALPPLNVPSEPHHMPHSSYGHHSLSPADDSPTSPSYSYPSRTEPLLHHNYPYQDSSAGQWFASGGGSSSSHNGSLSSLLNPSSNSSGTAYSQNSRPTPTINTAVHSSSSYSSPFSSIPLHGSEHPRSASSLSPDSHSRPPTGYSVAYDEYGSGSRPNSSHRQISPPSPRPGSSSRSPYHSTSHSSMILRRQRRHSQITSPYPSPYDNGDSSSSGSLTEHQRPSSSPQPDMHHGPSTHGHYSTHPSSLPRVRSMVQLSSDTSSTSPYSYNAHADFAYSPLPSAASASSTSVPSLTSVPSSSSISSMSSIHDYGNRHSTSGRPGTAASSMSVASGSSQANTPPMDGGGGAYEVGISNTGMGGETALVRGYEHDYGFVPMDNHELHSGYGKDM
jgi:hypothetical protein